MHGNEEVMHDNGGCSLSDSPINPLCEGKVPYSATSKGGHWNDSAISLGASTSRRENGIAYAGWIWVCVLYVTPSPSLLPQNSLLQLLNL